MIHFAHSADAAPLLPIKTMLPLSSVDVSRLLMLPLLSTVSVISGQHHSQTVDLIGWQKILHHNRGNTCLSLWHWAQLTVLCMLTAKGDKAGMSVFGRLETSVQNSWLNWICNGFNAVCFVAPVSILWNI